MGLITTLEQDAQAALTKAEEVFNHTRTIVETHLPAIAADVARYENDPFIQGILGARLAVPEHLVNVALDFLAKLVTVGGGTAPVPAPAATDIPVGLDAQPDQAA